MNLDVGGTGRGRIDSHRTRRVNAMTADVAVRAELPRVVRLFDELLSADPQRRHLPWEGYRSASPPPPLTRPEAS